MKWIPDWMSNPKLWLYGAIYLQLMMQLPWIGENILGHHVWRQSQTLMVARNYVEDDGNFFNPRVNEPPDDRGIQRQEFPVFQYGLSLIYRVSGESPIVYRLYTWLIAMIGVIGIYQLFVFWFSDKLTAALGTWAFTFSPVVYFYAISPLPDVLATSCLIWALALYVQFVRAGKNSHLWLSAILMSLSIAVKLPFITAGAFMAAHWLLSRPWHVRPKLKVAMIYGLCLIPALTWYAWVIPTWTNEGLKQGIFGDPTPLATTLNLLKYHFSSYFPVQLTNPAAVPFLLTALLFGLFAIRKIKVLELACVIAFLSISAYVLFEINMIGTPHDYYLMPYLPILYLLVTRGISQWLHADRKWLTYTCLFLLLLQAPMSWQVMRNRRGVERAHGLGMPRELYFNYETIRSLIPPEDWVVVGQDISHYIWLYYLDRKGLAMERDWAKPEDIRLYRTWNIKYWLSNQEFRDWTSQDSTLVKPIWQEGKLTLYQFTGAQ